MTRVALLLLFADAAFAATADFTWSGAIAPNQTFEVKGLNGPVRVLPSAGTGASLRALRKGRRDDPNHVRIDVVPHPAGITVCAVYPSADSRPNECKPGNAGRNNVSNNDVHVEFEIRLPRGVHLTVKTVNGDVEARQIGGDVKAETVNGEIVVAAQGNVEARTVNGGITLELHPSSGAALNARVTNGEIASDLPLTFRGGAARRQVEATIGNGSKQLKLQTVNGNIRIRQASS
ncbi:MAG: DUF4097 family beta strand repeat protein [Bryobacterales bacterium]|nr:DUF4097 family beta strand repeat protein [Bryobacterales bacterium]